MNATVEALMAERINVQEWERERRERSWGLFASTCAWCGSRDGMWTVDKETVAKDWEWWESEAFYRKEGVVGFAYYWCGACNPSRRVPEGYEEMTGEEVERWLDKNVGEHSNQCSPTHT